MNKIIIMVLSMLIAALCFVLSFIIMPKAVNKPVPVVIKKKDSTSSRLTWYTSIPQRHADKIANAFTQKSGIDVEIVRGSTFIVRDKLLSEIKCKTYRADVLTIADIGTYVALKDQGYLMKYISPRYKEYPQAYKETGYWATFAGFGICMAYHKSRIEKPPKQWTDLLNERWKGRIGLEDINTGGSQYGQYYMLREKLGVQFWEALLSRQQPKIYYRTEDLANALIEGEIDIAGQFSIHTVYDYKIKRKTPIEGIFPKEGIPFILNPIAIMNPARHPKEAMVFFDFLLSEEGQNHMQRLNYKYSVRTGITPLKGIPPLNSINLLNFDNSTDYLKNKRSYTQEFNSFFQKGFRK
jgi:iron(III) transport system substrate-binding protein